MGVLPATREAFFIGRLNHIIFRVPGGSNPGPGGSAPPPVTASTQDPEVTDYHSRNFSTRIATAGAPGILEDDPWDKRPSKIIDDVLDFNDEASAHETNPNVDRTWLDYGKNAAGQIFIGDLSESEPTLLGTSGDVAFALTGFDAYKDVGDGIHLVRNWENTWPNYAQLATIGLAFLPIAGAFVKGGKGVTRALDTADDVVEQAGNVAPNKIPSLTNESKDALRTSAREIWQARTGRRAIWDGMDVHHRIPLEWSHLFPKADANRVANLIGMRSVDHTLVTNAWNVWRQGLNGRVPTQAEVLQQALRIDEQLEHLMKFLP